MQYKRRQATLRGLLASNRLDALLVTHLPNIRYLCGFTGSAAAMLVTERNCWFFTDGRYTEQAKAEVQGSKIIVDRKSPLLLAAEWLKKNRERGGRWSLGVEAEHLTLASCRRMKANLPSHLRLKFAPPLIERARMVKDAEEIQRIRKAVEMGARLFDQTLPTMRPGVKEIEVAAAMEHSAYNAGAEGMSFPTIIASGPRSALPHGKASLASLPANGFVVCDFGVILAGYCSDQTRTVVLGRTSSEARHAYEAVKEAQQAAIEAVRPGASVSEPDEVGRKLLKKQGLARYFTHSTGHGVGLEIHEDPRLATGQNEIFRPGMVVTIEPGVYLPGKFGVRIEDMVLVTENGCEVLTPTSKELLEI
ncbi:MAG TPA: Xaa-Pro peptidase family protein [Terriglobales bacterium]|jgi:Xaa-Pro aminopeptidase